MSGMHRDAIRARPAAAVVLARTAASTIGRASLRLDARTRVALADAWRALWISRLIVWLSSLVALAIWGVSGQSRTFDPAALTRPFSALGDVLAAPVARWDSVWYLAIAHGGYDHDAARPAFFPLYPLLVRWTGFVTGSPLVAGALVSTAGFLVALVLLHRLVDLELGAQAARAAVFVTALFPMGFFFSAVYTEGLFLALSVGAVYAARTGRWRWAGILGALGAATRNGGVLLVLPLAALAWRERKGTERFISRRQFAWVALVPIGLAAYCGWLATHGLDAGAPFEAGKLWFRHFTGPLAGTRDAARAAWDGLRQLLSGSRTPVYFTRAGGDPFAVAGHNLVNFAFLIAAVPALVGTLRRLAPAYGAYALAAVALPLSYPVAPEPLMSLPRYLVVVFPLFMWLGWWIARGGPWRSRIVLGASGAGLAAFTAQFATWHWVA
jgi:Mannosyltransferase (PIG-V)